MREPGGAGTGRGRQPGIPTLRTGAAGSAILLARDEEVVSSALALLDELLAHRRRTAGPHEAREEVLAVWLRRDLEAGLPVWDPLRLDDRAAGGSGSAAVPPAPAATRQAACIRTSISLSGLWSFCRIEGGVLEGLASRRRRRRRILEALARDAAPACFERDLFCPVLGADEAPEELPAILGELRAAYPGRVADAGFREDPEHGLSCPRS